MSRIKFSLPIAVIAAALIAVPSAGAASTPTVSSVKPLKVGVGNTLTIRGKNFRAGKNKSTVIFRSTSGGRTVFVKADNATKTKISVTVPAKLMPYMQTKNGSAQSTRFQIRVVGKKLGKKYTSKAKSPLIGPVSATGTPGGSANASGDCDNDGIKNSVDTDDDNDQLPDTLEAAIKTDPCLADTDGDGVSDGYEYKAALDYNNYNAAASLPYPGKRPYPNPLDGSDAGIDHDSDGLTEYDEFSAWSYSGRPTTLNYSDGTPWTGGKVSAAFALTFGSGSVDSDGDGFINDSEKDVDNDGLDNFSEAHGPMSGPAWWTVKYGNSSHNTCGAAEKAYPLGSFQGTSFVDPDVDGDGVLDGADDIDHDGYSNAFEQYRPSNWCSTYVSTAQPGGANPKARTNPFNPCKPTYSDQCHSLELVQNDPALIDYYPSSEDWMAADPTAPGFTRTNGP